MDYEGFFKQRLDELRSEGRYRAFAHLERRCGVFPRAFDHRIGREVTVWCSNASDCDQYGPKARRILRALRRPKVAKSRRKGRSRLRAYP